MTGKLNGIKIPKNPTIEEIGEIIEQLDFYPTDDIQWVEWSISKRMEQLREKSSRQLRALYKKYVGKIREIKKSAGYEYGGGISYEMAIDNIHYLRKDLLRIVFLLCEIEETIDVDPEDFEF